MASWQPLVPLKGSLPLWRLRLFLCSAVTRRLRLPLLLDLLLDRRRRRICRQTLGPRGTAVLEQTRPRRARAPWELPPELPPTWGASLPLPPCRRHRSSPSSSSGQRSSSSLSHCWPTRCSNKG